MDSSLPLSADQLRALTQQGYLAGCNAARDDYQHGVLPHLPDYLNEQHINFAVGFADGYRDIYGIYARMNVLREDDIPSAG